MHRHILAALAISTALTAPAWGQAAKQSVAIYDGTGAEDTGKAPLRICKVGTDQKTPFDVHLNVAGSSTDTAKAGTDFTPIEDLHLDFAAGAGACQTIDLQLTNDQAPEASEFVTATITAGKGARLYDGKAKITITDSDPATQTCWDNSVIPWNQVCPPKPPPVTCWNGSVVQPPAECPVKPPEPIQCPDGSTVIPPATCPVVPPVVVNEKVALIGDSQGVMWPNTGCGGNWTNCYVNDATRKAKGLTYCALASTGMIIGTPTSANGWNNPTNLAKIDACNPEVVVYAPTGSNDQFSFTVDQWMANLWLFVDGQRAKGRKVVIGTPAVQGKPSDPAWATNSVTRVKLLRDRIVAEAPTHPGTFVIDTSSEPKLSTAAGVLDTAVYQQDQLHFTGCGSATGPAGQCVIYRLNAPKIDLALGISTTVPPVQCPDGSQVTPPATCPQPPTGPAGLPPIPSNFDVNLALRTVPVVTLTAKPDVLGAFRFICAPSHLNFDDPLVWPGQPGMAHLHQYYGNTLVNAFTTFESLRTTGGSTCNIVNGAPPNGVAVNRSGYWMPAMLDGKGYAVVPDYVSVYYKREPLDFVNDTGQFPATRLSPCQPGVQNVGSCINIPTGIGFIAGFNMLTGQPGVNKAKFQCIQSNGSTPIAGSLQETMVGLETKCVVGGYLEMSMQSPRCWNGQTRSGDHQSHVTATRNDASTGYKPKCPPSHPYYMPQFSISSFYRIVSGDNIAIWSLASDHQYPALPRGSTAHFDYLEGWDFDVRNMWGLDLTGCINGQKNCSAGNMGNGKQVAGAASGDAANYMSGKPRRILISSIPRG